MSHLSTFITSTLEKIPNGWNQQKALGGLENDVQIQIISDYQNNSWHSATIEKMGGVVLLTCPDTLQEKKTSSLKMTSLAFPLLSTSSRNTILPASVPAELQLSTVGGNPGCNQRDNRDNE